MIEIPLNVSGANQQALIRFMQQIITPPARKGISNWRILTPADRMAGSSLEAESFPATSMDESSTPTGDVISRVEGTERR